MSDSDDFALLTWRAEIRADVLEPCLHLLRERPQEQ